MAAAGKRGAGRRTPSGEKAPRATERRAAHDDRRAPGRPTGGSGDETRERIMSAALEIFARQGLAGASMRDIAHQARIRVSSLYHYFPSKEALYAAVVERADSQIRDIMVSVMAKNPDLRSVARETIGRTFDFMLANRAYAQLGFRMSLDGAPTPAAAQRTLDRWVGLTEGTMKPMELRGEIKAIDPALFMITMDALLQGHIVRDGLYRRILGKGLEDPALARRAREHVVQVALRMLGLE